MSRRSTPLIGVGAAALAVGALATFAGISSDGPKKVTVGQSAAGAEAGAPGAPSLKIPEGKQALAVSLDPVAGTAGIAKAGSRIDVFAAVSQKDDKGGTHAARLILQNIEVLQVQTATAPLKDSPTGNPVFVLAVNGPQAEKVVYHASFSKLWFSVVNDNAPAVATPGVNPANELIPEA